MSNISETASSNGDWEDMDTDGKIRSELDEQREQLTKYKEENAKLKEENERLREHQKYRENEKNLCELEEHKKKLSLYEEETSKLVEELDRLKTYEKSLESQEELRRQLEEEQKRAETYKERYILLRDEIEKLKEEESEEAQDQTEESNKTNRAIDEKRDEFSTAREKPWMILAIKEFQSGNTEILELSTKLFKSFAQQEAVAKKRSLPCNIDKTMKQIKALEKECKVYMDGILKWNKKQLKSAKKIVETTAKRMTQVAVLDDLHNLVELSDEVIEFADVHLEAKEISYTSKIYQDYVEDSVLPCHMKLEKCDQGQFYKETLTFKDGGRIVCRWRPDNVLRDGVRVVLEKDRLNVYCITGKLLRHYNKDRTYVNYEYE